MSLIERILLYLMWPVHFVDMLIMNGFKYQPSFERAEGWSPYDRIDRVAFAAYWPETGRAIHEAEISLEQPKPRPMADYSWVAPSMVEAVIRQMDLERRAPSAHGFLGKLGEQGAYVVAATRPTAEIVAENAEVFEEKAGFVVEDEPKPQPEKRRTRRPKMVVAGATA